MAGGIVARKRYKRTFVPRPPFRFDAPSSRAIRGFQVSRSEWKSVDVNTTVATDTTGTVTLLNGLARGDDIGDRSGREVLLKSVQLKYETYGTNATGVQQEHRVLLLYDRQTNAAAPVIADILTAISTTHPRNLENRKRFKIFMDRTVSLGVAITASFPRADSVHCDDYFRKLRHPMVFNGNNNANVGDIVSGAIFLVTIGSIAAGATAGSTAFSSRIRFVDY